MVVINNNDLPVTVKSVNSVAKKGRKRALAPTNNNYPTPRRINVNMTERACAVIGMMGMIGLLSVGWKRNLRKSYVDLGVKDVEEAEMRRGRIKAIYVVYWLWLCRDEDGCVNGGALHSYVSYCGFGRAGSNLIIGSLLRLRLIVKKDNKDLFSLSDIGYRFIELELDRVRSVLHMVNNDSLPGDVDVDVRLGNMSDIFTLILSNIDKFKHNG